MRRRLETRERRLGVICVYLCVVMADILCSAVSRAGDLPPRNPHAPAHPIHNCLCLSFLTAPIALSTSQSTAGSARGTHGSFPCMSTSNVSHQTNLILVKIICSQAILISIAPSLSPPAPASKLCQPTSFCVCLCCASYFWLPGVHATVVLWSVEL